VFLTTTAGLRWKIVIGLAVSPDAMIPTSRPASLAADGLFKRLQRDIEINAVLAGPFAGIEITRFLARPAYEPEALPLVD